MKSVKQASGDSSPESGQRRTPRLEGLGSRGRRFAIAAARFNDNIVNRLIDGALGALEEAGTPRSEVQVVRVPGAFELPLAVRGLAASGRFDAVIALGCVIRGETAHFEHVSRIATDGLGRVALDYGIPVGFGVLTTDTPEQAAARAGGVVGNLGLDAARAAIEMVVVLRSLS